MLREHVETEEALEATDKATADLASYHACVDVERVDYLLVEQLLAFLYSEGRFSGAQVLTPSCLETYLPFGSGIERGTRN